MRTVFADTFFWLALVHPRDAWHQHARAYLGAFTGRLVTTEWVLMELGDGLARTPQGRQEFVSLRTDLQTDPDVSLVASDSQLMNEAVALYQSRPDKEWSLTDCTSFVVMRREGILEALTGDHHFEQAGYVVLLK